MRGIEIIYEWSRSLTPKFHVLRPSIITTDYDYKLLLMALYNEISFSLQLPFTIHTPIHCPKREITTQRVEFKF